MSAVAVGRRTRALRGGVGGGAPARKEGASVDLPVGRGGGVGFLLLLPSADQGGGLFDFLCEVLLLRRGGATGGLLGLGERYILGAASVVVVAEVDKDPLGGRLVIRVERYEQTRRKKCGEVAHRDQKSGPFAFAVVVGSVIIHGVPVSSDWWPG